jgi:hypothetical protein
MMPKNSFNTIEVLALAIAAYKQAGNKIERLEGHKVGNKELVLGYLKGELEFVGCRDKTLPEQAELIRNEIANRVTINALTGAVTNSFLLKIHEAISNDTVCARDIGIVVWTPKLADDLAREDEHKVTISSIGVNSRYIGKPTEKITLDFTLIKHKYLQNYNMYIHTGHDQDGNLVSFFNKNKVESGKISARVKTYKQDRYLNNSCVTVLNYVKVL